MEERYMISVVGKQTVDGESDSIEVITAGDMIIDGDKITIIIPLKKPIPLSPYKTAYSASTVRERWRRT